MSAGLFVQVVDTNVRLSLSDRDRIDFRGPAALQRPDRALIITVRNSGDDEVEITLTQAQAHALVLALDRYERKWRGERERRAARQARRDS